VEECCNNSGCDVDWVVHLEAVVDGSSLMAAHGSDRFVDCSCNDSLVLHSVDWVAEEVGRYNWAGVGSCKEGCFDLDSSHCFGEAAAVVQSCFVAEGGKVGVEAALDSCLVVVG